MCWKKSEYIVLLPKNQSNQCVSAMPSDHTLIADITPLSSIPFSPFPTLPSFRKRGESCKWPFFQVDCGFIKSAMRVVNWLCPVSLGLLSFARLVEGCMRDRRQRSVLQCVSFQGVAVCCSVLQSIAVCCSVSICKTRPRLHA